MTKPLPCIDAEQFAEKVISKDQQPLVNKWNNYLYPNHFKVQDSVGIRNTLGKALIEEHGYSLFKINNAA